MYQISFIKINQRASTPGVQIEQSTLHMNMDSNGSEHESEMHELFLQLSGFHQGSVIAHRTGHHQQHHHLQTNAMSTISSLDGFIDDVGFVKSIVDAYKYDTQHPSSSFHRMLGKSIDAIVIQPYYDTLVEIEREITSRMKNQQQQGWKPMPRIRFLLGDFIVIVPFVARFLRSIQDLPNDYLILDEIYSNTLSGIPCVSDVFQRIFTCASRDFIRLLALWLDKGELLPRPRQNAFFIQERIYPTTSLHPGGVQHKQRDSLIHSAMQEQLWKTRFTVDPDMCPTKYVLTLELAEHILYIGKVERLVFKNESANEFLQAMNLLLANKVLELKDLHSAIENSYNRCSERLLHRLIANECLIDRLRIARDIFLLGRGDFFRDVLFESQKNRNVLDAGVWKKAVDAFFHDIGNERYLHDIQLMRLERFSEGDTSQAENPIVWKSSKPDLFQPLTLVGATTVSNGNIHFPSDEPCAVWLASKQHVEDGFLLEFDVNISSQARPSRLFAFVVHHSVRFGTSLLHEQDLVNGIVLLFDFLGGTFRLLSRNPQLHQFESLFIAKFPPIDPRDPVRVLVRHSSQTSKMQIDIQDGRVMSEKCILTLGRSMSLERGSGRAWVGCMTIPAAAAIVSASSEGIDHSASYSIQNWKLSTPKQVDVLETQTVKLCWDLAWPLQLIFSDDVIDRYNILFRFLFSVLKVGNDLNKLWTILSVPMYRINTSSDMLHRVWNLRASMSFLVDTLQFHLQVDVIDTCFQQLLSKIELSRSLDEAIEQHALYLQQMTTKCMIHNRVVRIGMNHVLKWCEGFSTLIDSIDSKLKVDVEMTIDEIFEEYSAEITTIAEGFRVDANELCETWQTVNPELAMRIPQDTFKSE